jgi:hypothetical protein
MRGDVIDAVVDDQRRAQRVDQHLGLWHVCPQDRGLQAEPARRAPYECRQQPGVQRAHEPASMQRHDQR